MDSADAIVSDTCANHRHDYTPCSPPVACFSPNSETRSNWDTYGMGSVALCVAGTDQTRWYGYVHGTMIDPFALTVNDFVEAIVETDGAITFAEGLGAGANQDESPTHYTGDSPCPPNGFVAGGSDDSAWEAWS